MLYPDDTIGVMGAHGAQREASARWCSGFMEWRPSRHVGAGSGDSVLLDVFARYLMVCCGVCEAERGARGAEKRRLWLYHVALLKKHSAWRKSRVRVLLVRVALPELTTCSAWHQCNSPRREPALLLGDHGWTKWISIRRY